MERSVASSTSADFRTVVEGLFGALEHAADGVLIVDAGGRVLRANATARRILGCETGEVRTLAQNYEEQEPRRPDGTPLAWDELPLVRCLHGETVPATDVSVRRPDGSRAIITISATPLARDPDSGQVLGGLVIIRDVTQQREEERRNLELLASLERQRLLLEATFEDVPVGIAVLVPPDWRHEMANAVYTGIPAAATVSGATLAEAFPPPLAARLGRTLRRALESGKPARLSDAKVERPGAEPCFWTFTFRPCHDSAGRTDRVLVVAWETTQQIRARQRLAETAHSIEVARRHLEGIVDNLPEGVLIIQRAETPVVVLSNRTARDLMGMEIGPGYRPPLRQLAARLRYPNGRRYRLRDLPVVRALQGEQVLGAELLFIRPDGSQVQVLMNQGPIRDRHGNVTGALVVFQDVTRLKEVERLKDDFISMVSHELRTPTTTIQAGALTLLRRDRHLKPAEKQQLLRDIADEATRLHLLVEDLLGMASVEAGLQPHVEPVVPHRFVNQLVLEMRNRLVRHLLTVEVPPDLPAVDADPVALAQVLRNLLDNAVKYSRPGTRIIIDGRAVDGYVQISVLDEGLGLTAEEAQQVFAPFYRTEGARREALAGAGLGLTICRRLVEAMGGRIWAEPRPAGGAAFHFTLRRADLDDTDDGL
ncbi:MAG TPA: PAS domain-containing protein [Dehalococcoidia bacterium]